MAMKAPDLEVVFGKGPKRPPGESMGAQDDGADMPDEDEPDSDDAENSAIDEMFTTKDPEARREAFKNAVRLCSQKY